MSKSVQPANQQVIERNAKGRLKMTDGQYRLLRFEAMRRGIDNDMETVLAILEDHWNHDKTEEKLQKALSA